MPDSENHEILTTLTMLLSELEKGAEELKANGGLSVAEAFAELDA